MNDNAKEWVKELRSGKYVQGKINLRSRQDEYCCLGVACDMAVKAGVIPEPKVHSHGDAYVYGDHNLGGLPYQVMTWLGLRDSLGEYYGNKSLAFQNDKGMKFDQIADIIESEPEGLFNVER